jgi:hypothetical protein
MGFRGSWVQIPPSRLTNTIAGHARVLCLWPGRWNLVVATRVRLVASVPNPTVPTQTSGLWLLFFSPGCWGLVAASRFSDRWPSRGFQPWSQSVASCACHSSVWRPRCAGEAGGDSKGVNGPPGCTSAFIRPLPRTSAALLQHQRDGQRTARAMLLAGPSPALFTPLTRYSYSTPDSWPLSVTSLSTDMPTSIQSPLSRVRRWTR